MLVAAAHVTAGVGAAPACAVVVVVVAASPRPPMSACVWWRCSVT
jgi:hypothetical protein